VHIANMILNTFI